MRNTKFKVGDKVKIKDYLQGGRDYGKRYFNPDMSKYLGKITTVSDKDYDDYLLDIDDNEWFWDDEMLTRPSKAEVLKFEIEEKQKELNKLLEEPYFPESCSWEEAIKLLKYADRGFRGGFVEIDGTVHFDLRIENNVDWEFSEGKKLL